jgi:hypothetical protein
MRTATIVFRLFGAGAIVGGSFFGTLTFIDYRAQQHDTQLFLDKANESSTRSTPVVVTMVVDPPSLPECAAPGVAKISWNASAAGVQSVKIFVRDKNGQEALFFSGDPTGSASTGAWVGAGTRFVLRDGYTSKQITDVSVGSDNCPEPPNAAGAPAASSPVRVIKLRGAAPTLQGTDNSLIPTPTLPSAGVAPAPVPLRGSKAAPAPVPQLVGTEGPARPVLGSKASPAPDPGRPADTPPPPPISPPAK